MIDTDLRHKIVSLLKRGPYMKAEIQHYCRPHPADDTSAALLALERSGVLRYLPSLGLYALVDA